MQTQQQKTLDELCEWIIKNRRGWAFCYQDGPCIKFWTKMEIAAAFDKGFRDHTAFFAMEGPEFVGVVEGFVIPNTNTYFARNILTTKVGVFKQFIQCFQKNFPNHDLRCVRKGKLVHYKISKFCNHVNGLC